MQMRREPSSGTTARGDRRADRAGRSAQEMAEISIDARV